MIPQFVFFPFTHIRENQLAILSAFFPQISFLPVKKEKNDLPHIKMAVEQGRLKRILLADQALGLAAQKSLQYVEWAKIHKGNEHNLKAIIKDSAYFTSDTQISAIKSQIRSSAGKKDEVQVQSFEKELLFLSMAQMCDEQNEQVELELKNVEKKREKLFSVLKGDEEPFESILKASPVEDADPGLVMTRERILSWAGGIHLSQSMDLAREKTFLVTTSPAVMDYLESICTDVINALDIDQIKVHENNCRMKNEWQHRFCESLMLAVQGGSLREKELLESADSCKISGQVRLRIFSGDLVEELFKISGRQIVVCLVNLK